MFARRGDKDKMPSRIKKRIKYIKVKSHGVAYFKTRFKGRNYLSGKPLIGKNYTISRGDDSFDVEQAPKSFKKTHEVVARKLGISALDFKKQMKGVYY